MPLLNMHPNPRSENKCCVSRNKHYFISSGDCSKTLNLVMSDIAPWSLLISEAPFLYTLEYIPYTQFRHMHILMDIHAGYMLGWGCWMGTKGCPAQPPPSNQHTVTQVFTGKMRAICRELGGSICFSAHPGNSSCIPSLFTTVYVTKRGYSSVLNELFCEIPA